MKSLVRIGVGVVVVIVGLGAMAQAVARRRTVGDDTSDDFAIAVYVGGVQRSCKARALRRGVVSVVCGGVDLDLREATLAPEGATLDLSASWGGVNVVVPREWRVTVEDRSVLGGFDAKVTPPEELPDDAPRLDVSVTARFGGVTVKAAEPAGEGAGSSHELQGWAST
ncbi:MAG TPA: LiaF domain-containing protein [Gaiella sp.]|jgi:hypothetical protein|nr:LiaF domain-containing protein [Gaiella sp.]